MLTFGPPHLHYNPMKKLLKPVLWTIVIVVLAVVGIGLIWLNTSPQFGGRHTDEDLARYGASEHFDGKIFVNLIPTSLDIDFKTGLRITREMLKGGGNKKPDELLKPEKFTKSQWVPTKEAKVMWFGHSAMLVFIDEMSILIDPMLSEVPAPHPMLGQPRFATELPMALDSIGHVDAILISHDHYDHLDYESIKQLKDRCDQFLVPLGVGAHLRRWDVPEAQIQELDWWDETTYKGLNLAFTPSRHFSGRGINDRSTTLWGSWVIIGENERIYFSGDGGYGPHFKEIGEKYGPFDFAMMECGQYNPSWDQIHMMPEETAQAGVDVQAKRVMPIHWGAFTLAMHSWTDPVERVSKKAAALDLPLVTPEIGRLFTVQDSTYSGSQWWIKD